MILLPSGMVHDCWMTVHPVDGRLHLFHLHHREERRDYPPGGFAAILHHVSADGIAWREVERIEPFPGEQIGTGMVFWDGDDAAMTVTRFADRAIWHLRPRDGLGLSDWSVAGDGPLLHLAGRWYEERDTGDPATTAHFRDAFIEHRDGRFHAYATARSRDAAPGRGGCVWHASAPDLRTWTVHPPALADIGFFQAEVPDRFALDGRHYLLFSDNAPRPLSVRGITRGTWYAFAEHADGPYRLPAEPLLLGSGNDRLDSYVGRQVRFGGEPLLYHHHLGARWCVGLPKRIRADGDGHLHLAAWEAGIARLRRGSLDLGPDPQAPEDAPAAWWPAEIDDVELHFDCRFARAGQVADILVRNRLRLRLDPGAGRAELHRLDRDAHVLVDACPFAGGDRCRLRLLCRGPVVEAYADDRLLLSTLPEDLPLRGRIGVAATDGPPPRLEGAWRL